jgi:hypothetical protein
MFGTKNAKSEPTVKLSNDTLWLVEIVPKFIPKIDLEIVPKLTFTMAWLKPYYNVKDILGQIQGQFQDNFGTICGQFWDYLWTILGLFAENFGTNNSKSEPTLKLSSGTLWLVFIQKTASVEIDILRVQCLNPWIHLDILYATK